MMTISLLHLYLGKVEGSHDRAFTLIPGYLPLKLSCKSEGGPGGELIYACRQSIGEGSTDDLDREKDR